MRRRVRKIKRSGLYIPGELCTTEHPVEALLMGNSTNYLLRSWNAEYDVMNGELGGCGRSGRGLL
jgi:hypothetical protein